MFDFINAAADAINNTIDNTIASTTKAIKAEKACGSEVAKGIIATASNMVNADGKCLKRINFNMPLPKGKKFRSGTAIGMILTERQFMRCLSAHARGTTITINGQIVDFGFKKELINRTGFNPKQPVYFVVR